MKYNIPDNDSPNFYCLSERHPMFYRNPIELDRINKKCRIKNGLMDIDLALGSIYDCNDKLHLSI